MADHVNLLNMHETCIQCRKSKNMCQLQTGRDRKPLSQLATQIAKKPSTFDPPSGYKNTSKLQRQTDSRAVRLWLNRRIVYTDLGVLLSDLTTTVFAILRIYRPILPILRLYFQMLQKSLSDSPILRRWYRNPFPILRFLRFYDCTLRLSRNHSPIGESAEQAENLKNRKNRTSKVIFQYWGTIQP